LYFSMFLGPRVFGPQFDLVTIQASIDQALQADEAGFSAVYVGEQHHNNYEPYSDPFTMAGYLAPQLKNAWIGTSVVPLVLHHPLKLIERMNLLDLLMRGKVMYGLSSGQPNNGTAFGIHEMDSGYRARLYEQRLNILLRAWEHRLEDGAFEFETDAERGIMQGRVMPYSYRAPHPLFAVATSTESKVAEAGKRGFYVHLGPTDNGHLGQLLRVYRAGLDESGLGESAIEQRVRWLIHTKWIIVAETDDEAWASAQQQFGAALHFIPWLTKDAEYQGKSLRELHGMEPGPFAPAFGMPESPAAWTQRCHIVGSPETVAAQLRAYADMGVPHIHGRWIMSNLGLESGQRSLRLFIDEVMPRVGIDRMPDLTADEISAFATTGTEGGGGDTTRVYDLRPTPGSSGANEDPTGGAQSVEGEWHITIDTPMGAQSSTLKVSSDGHSLTGNQGNDGETADIYDGSISGAEATWKLDVTSPMPLTITFNGVVDGDSITGQAQAGFFPPAPFTGSRA
jgi:alkanesulfonate monooxygenase SsuD/methylene tetrahydromethanopterin reductase-like flavin-dependent oxidoreductase (luciferase family)